MGYNLFYGVKTSEAPLSEEYIRWAIQAYDNRILPLYYMDDVTMDVIEKEQRRRRQKRRAREEEARSRKRKARIQKVETWISSFDTFHTVTKIKVEPRKLQKVSMPISPLQSSSTSVPLVSKAPPPPPTSLPSPLKPATPVLSLPDDLVPSIILKETTKHEDEDFSPPIDTFDSGPIWDKEEKEKVPKAVLVFTPPKKEILPSSGIRSFLSSLATPWMDATPYIASLVPHFFQRPEVRPLERLADSRSNPFKGGEDDVILTGLPSEAIQVLDPDDEAELGNYPFEKTALRQFGILARTGSIKFRLKHMSTCWKAILSGYKFHLLICTKLDPEEAQKCIPT